MDEFISLIKKNAKVILLAVFIIYVILMTSYIFYNRYQNKLDSEFDGGREAAINELLGRAERCEPFQIFNDENKSAQLISIECLQIGEGDIGPDGQPITETPETQETPEILP